MKQIVHLKEPTGAITSPTLLFDRITEINISYSQENLLLFTLDTRQKLICCDTLFKGGIDSMIIDPRNLFSKVLKDGAAGFIIAHNHPSGELDPSDEDLQVTNILKKGADLLKITFCDHIIFNRSEYYSLSNAGHI
jgi:DNA repair protein RadC